MELQAPDPAIRLIDLPTEVLGNICRLLRLKDRVRFTVTCRFLLHGLASSVDAWGTLVFTRGSDMPSCLAWIPQRRQGLRRLELDALDYQMCNFVSGVSRDAAQLAACLEGSPLVQLKLRHLWVYYSGRDTVLQQLSSCTALRSLALDACMLDCIPISLELLPALEELSLQSSRLAGANWELLSQLATLTRLDITHCDLAALPAELAALPALADLSLASNVELGGASWACLQQLTALTRLDATDCGLAALPAEVASRPALAVLLLGGNGELGAAAADTWAPLAQCSRLAFLGLRSIPFTQLPRPIAALGPHLRSLDLSYTAGLWRSGEAALDPLYSLSRLTWLNLAGCGVHPRLYETLSGLVSLNLDDRDLWCLPPELAQLGSCLAELSLRRNLMGVPEGGTAEQQAAQWAVLEQLTGLTRLDVSQNKLTYVPPVFSALTRLRVLCLMGNWHLARGGVEALRPLVSMTALQHLDLTGCNLPRQLELDAIPFPLHRLEG